MTLEYCSVAQNHQPQLTRKLSTLPPGRMKSQLFHLVITQTQKIEIAVSLGYAGQIRSISCNGCGL